jgi:hypothetical protein
MQPSANVNGTSIHAAVALAIIVVAPATINPLDALTASVPISLRFSSGYDS